MSVVESKVTGIIKSLNILEDDLDSLNAKSADMKKQLVAKAQSEIDALLTKTREMALKETKDIIAKSRDRATAESLQISQDSETKLAELKSKIESNFDAAVKDVVTTILKP